MKILIPLVGSFSKEGGWRVLSQLANHWKMMGHDVMFLSHINFTEPYFPTDVKIKFYDSHGTVYDNHFNEMNTRVYGGPFLLRIGLRKAIEKIECDVILATHNFTANPVAKARNSAKKFYYVQAYEPEFYENGPLRFKFYKQIAKRSYKLGLKIIVNSEMYLNYKEIISDKVVYPGLDLNLFHPKEYTIMKNKTFIIGSIGRKEIVKGTKYIVEAFKVLRKELGSQVELHLAFGDIELNKIEGIKVMSPRNDNELADFYRSLDCYVCAGVAQLDAVHYPVLESFACKIPLITTGYYPSSVFNSLRINIKDIKDIVCKVKMVFKKDVNLDLMTQQGLKDVQVFDWENVSVSMINYFSEK